ncbi:hypothetical protein ACO9S2_07780 [Nitrospira sp. NS4]|uniref:hypothetical protein n=1 Tax=Nitrospira sp. NS4 TaxID=3414498 RepID=UPI003C2D4319
MTFSTSTGLNNLEVGEEVAMQVNENNDGKEKHMKGTHRLISGKLIRTGPNKNQVKFSTPEGEKVFPLERMEVKTKHIAEAPISWWS